MSIPDSAEKIAEEITEVIAEARADAVQEMAEADRQLDLLQRLDGIDARIAEIEARATAPEATGATVADAVAELRDIAEDIAESSAALTTDAVEETAHTVEEIPEDVVDTLEDVTEDVAPKVDSKPKRGHRLFRRLWGDK